MPNAVKIGKRIKKLRKEKGYTLRKLAKMTNVTATAISNYECGIRIPRDSTKIFLAQALGTTVESIFFKD